MGLLALDWIEQCFMSTPTLYRLYGRRFLKVKRPNQQHQSTEGTNTQGTQKNQTDNKQTWTQNTASPIVYNNMGWLGDGFHRRQGCQAWMAVGLLPAVLPPVLRLQQPLWNDPMCLLGRQTSLDPDEQFVQQHHQGPLSSHEQILWHFKWTCVEYLPLQ